MQPRQVANPPRRICNHHAARVAALWANKLALSRDGKDDKCTTLVTRRLAAVSYEAGRGNRELQPLLPLTLLRYPTSSKNDLTIELWKDL